MVPKRPVGLRPRPPRLAGREALLAAVDERLTAPSESAGPGGVDVPRVVALTGMGGVGKTSTALEYAYRHLGRYQVAWQVSCQDSVSTAADFGKLARQLGVDAEDAGDTTRAVHAALAASQDVWLLLLDNVPDPRAIRDVLPPAGNGHVLITSQSRLWPAPRLLPVDVLDPEPATAFLHEVADTDADTCALLAAEVGYLPLALAQIAAYLQHNGTSPARYLALYRERRAELLARGTPTDYDHTVATTWSMAFEQVNTASPAAGALLRILAHCAPDAIPLDLLITPHTLDALDHEDELDRRIVDMLQPVAASPIALDDALSALSRYCLTSPPERHAVSIHRLVQAATRDSIPAPDTTRWQQAVATLITTAVPDDPGQPATWPALAALTPHVLHTLPPHSLPTWRVALYLRARGDYTAAEQLLRRILDAERHLHGHDQHPDALATRHALARVLHAQGQYEQAKAEYRAILDARREAGFDDRHPHTLATRHALARVLHAQGQYEQAETEYRAILDARREAGFDDRHPDTLATRHALASVLHDQGQYEQAKAEYRAILDARRELLGDRHPDSLATRHALASVLHDQGQYEQAKDEYRAILDARREAGFDDRHPHTLATRHALASVLHAQGQYEQAKDEYRAILDARREAGFDDRHPAHPGHPPRPGQRAARPGPVRAGQGRVPRHPRRPPRTVSTTGTRTPWPPATPWPACCTTRASTSRPRTSTAPSSTPAAKPGSTTGTRTP